MLGKRKISIILVTVAVAALAVWALTASGASQASGCLDGTRNGNPVGQPLVAPQVVNDFHGYWKPYGGAALRWTVNGQPVGPKLMSPANANDIDFDYNAAGNFTYAYWTKDGVR